jgi:hypothetical protein
MDAVFAGSPHEQLPTPENDRAWRIEDRDGNGIHHPAILGTKHDLFRRFYSRSPLSLSGPEPCREILTELAGSAIV